MRLHFTVRAPRRSVLAALALAAVVGLVSAPAVAASSLAGAPPQPVVAAYEKDVVIIRWTETNHPSTAALVAFEDTYKLAPPAETGDVDTYRFQILDGTDPKAKAEAVRKEPFVDWAGTTDDPIPPRANPWLPIVVVGLVLIVAVILLLAFGPAWMRNWLPGAHPSEAELDRLRVKSEHAERHGRRKPAASDDESEAHGRKSGPKPATRRRAAQSGERKSGT